MKRLLIALVLLSATHAALSASIPPFGGQELYRTDLMARRARAMQALGSGSVLVLWSAPARVYSTDVNYEYRQDSYLWYLSGITQEETILVLASGAASKEVLFTRESNPTREHWNGHTLTPAEVADISGVRDVRPLAAFDGFLNGLLETHAAAGATPVKLAVLMERAGPNGPAPALGSRRAWVDQMKAKFPTVSGLDAAPVLNSLRQVKTAYEQTVLRRSLEISADAHIAGMRATKPGRWEYETEAAIEYTYLKNGAMSWGYPSIVGSGPNATTLHYEASERQMAQGDLLLVDAAADFQGMTGDITRTYPVSGTFTKIQRDVYELVLAGQQAGIAAATAGNKFSDITAAVRKVFGPGLLKLGLITDANSNQQIGVWLTHGVSHGIGFDVHDPGDTSKPIAPGWAFTIEPGLYIRNAALENLAQNFPDRAAFVAAVSPAVTKYKDIGVRIEDSFLVTDRGTVNLSAKAPRAVADLEKIIGRDR